MFDRVAVAAHPREHEAKRRVRRGVVRIETKGCLELLDCAGGITHLREGHAQTEPCVGARGRALDSLAERRRSLIESSRVVRPLPQDHLGPLTAQQGRERIDDGIGRPQSSRAAARQVRSRLVDSAQASIGHSQRVMDGRGVRCAIERGLEVLDRLAESAVPQRDLAQASARDSGIHLDQVLEQRSCVR